jgi:hypothetical protein
VRFLGSEGGAKVEVAAWLDVESGTVEVVGRWA